MNMPKTRTTILGLALAGLLSLSGCVVAPVGPPRPAFPVYRSAPPPPPVAVAPLYFYPLLRQPEAVQDRDRYECYRWAVRETGTDPGMTAVRSQGSDVVRERHYAPPGPNGADVVAGAATGAILGAAVSSPRHAGANAVIGAIFGAALTRIGLRRCGDEQQDECEAGGASGCEPGFGPGCGFPGDPSGGARRAGAGFRHGDAHSTW